MGGRELSKETGEPSRRCEDEHPTCARHDTALRMWDAARCEHETSRADSVLVVSDLDDVLTVEDVEELVLSVVDVERRVGQRRNLLEEVEWPARGSRRCADENRHLAEDEALTVVGVEGEPRHWFGHAWTIRHRWRDAGALRAADAAPTASSWADA